MKKRPVRALVAKPASVPELLDVRVLGGPSTLVED
jgi:hypothetical protein